MPQKTSKWVTAKILVEQQARLSELVVTPQAKRMGIANVNDAVKQAVADLIAKIEEKIEREKIIDEYTISDPLIKHTL